MAGGKPWGDLNHLEPHDWHKVETAAFNKWQCSKCGCAVASGGMPPAYHQVITFQDGKSFEGNCGEIQVWQVMLA